MNGINSLLPKSVHSSINFVRFSRVLSYLKVLKILNPFAPEPPVTARVACEQALLFGRVKRVSRVKRASAPRSRVLARLASLAQIGELARRLPPVRIHVRSTACDVISFNDREQHCPLICAGR